MSYQTETDEVERRTAGDSNARPWVPLLGGMFIVLVWGGSWISLRDDPERGSFGDMFGAANALFSGLAFPTARIRTKTMTTTMSKVPGGAARGLGSITPFNLFAYSAARAGSGVIVGFSDSRGVEIKEALETALWRQQENRGKRGSQSNERIRC